MYVWGGQWWEEMTVCVFSGFKNPTPVSCPATSTSKTPEARVCPQTLTSPETFCAEVQIKLYQSRSHGADCTLVCVTSCYWSYLGSRQSEDPSVRSFLKACSASSSLALSVRTGNLTGENQQPLATKTGLLMMLALFQPGKVSALLRIQLMLQNEFPVSEEREGISVIPAQWGGGDSLNRGWDPPPAGGLLQG